MPARETGKQRASRIPLDYYKGWTPLDRWFVGAGAAALVLAIAWPLAAYFFTSDGGETLYSRGPVTAKHGAWNADCSACHDNFSPIHERVAFSAGKVDNHKCTTCHAGPVHHKTQLTDSSCASCHRDHQGRDFSLVRVPDVDCTSCHANLPSHVQGGKTIYEHAVTRFAAATHPEFRSVKSDPGKLKFNHQLHMTAGMVREADGLGAFTFERMTEPDRKRYMTLLGANDPAAKVQLNCASCHVTDSGDFKLDATRIDVVPGDLLLPKRGTGAYMLPISYENQCRACHPTTFDRKDPKDITTGQPILHGLQPEGVREFLQGYYTSRFLAGNEALFEVTPGKPRPLPGKVATPAQQLTLKERIGQAEKDIFLGQKNCGECHYYDGAGAGAEMPKRVVETRVPSVWLEHAKFSHLSHRAVDCKECHADAWTSKTEKSVLIPNRDNCLQCHAPQTKVQGKLVGGARFDCIECHRYHNGDHPLQGLGAAARSVPAPLQVQPFLSGGKGK